MGFVHNGDPERYLTHDVKVANKSVVSRNQYIKLQKFWCVRLVFVVPFIFSHDIPPYALPVVVNTADHISPPLELSSPMLYGGQRNNDQVRPTDLLHSKKMLQVANDLDSLQNKTKKC